MVGWGKIEIKDQLSSAESETGAELGNESIPFSPWSTPLLKPMNNI